MVAMWPAAHNMQVFEPEGLPVRVYLADSYVSLIECAEDPAQLVVRACLDGDIDRFLGEHAPQGMQIERTPGPGYLFRAVVSREVVAAALAGAVKSVRYRSLHGGTADDKRRAAYTACWSAMFRLQISQDVVQRARRFVESYDDAAARVLKPGGTDAE